MAQKNVIDTYAGYISVYEYYDCDRHGDMLRYHDNAEHVAILPKLFFTLFLAVPSTIVRDMTFRSKSRVNNGNHSQICNNSMTW